MLKMSLLPATTNKRSRTLVESMRFSKRSQSSLCCRRCWKNLALGSLFEVTPPEMKTFLGWTMSTANLNLEKIVEFEVGFRASRFRSVTCKNHVGSFESLQGTVSVAEKKSLVVMVLAYGIIEIIGRQRTANQKYCARR